MGGVTTPKATINNARILLVALLTLALEQTGQKCLILGRDENRLVTLLDRAARIQKRLEKGLRCHVATDGGEVGTELAPPVVDQVTGGAKQRLAMINFVFFRECSF